LRRIHALKKEVVEDGNNGTNGTNNNDENPTDKEKKMMSWPLNFMERSPFLTGELAGDAGFDPLRVVTSQEQLFILREAEVKHCRLALLASIGWPISELYHYEFSRQIKMDNLLVFGKAPSILNGGLDNTYVLSGLLVFFLVGSYLEYVLWSRRREVPESLRRFYDMWREDGWDAPGNYGFDPLGLREKICGNNDEKKKMIQTIEIFNGRSAMLAVVGYAAQEYFTELPVVSETPFFFGL
jgi:hypothetical protein